MCPQQEPGDELGPTQGQSPHLRGQAYQGRTVTTPKTKKKFGQHWLTSTKVIQRTIDAAVGLRGVLEIGPGIGVLTAPLTEMAQVTCVELDDTLLDHLAERAPKARIVVADALACDWSDLLAELPQPAGIVSNMPYNITGPLLDRVYNCAGLIDRAVLMMQKEVGDKIQAKAGDSGRGALSVVFQDRFEIRLVCNVPPGAFSPPPKVDSTVLQFVPKQTWRAGLYAVAHRAFHQPRKTLANNLRGTVRPEDLAAILDEFGLSSTVRPHELPDPVWPRLVDIAD